MYSELYAIATALLRGFSVIPTRKGLQHSNPNTSALICLIIRTIFLWSMTFCLYPIDQIIVSGFEYFILSGILAPGIALILRDTSFNRIGVTITSSIVSTNTLFSILLAVFFLGEEITIYLVLGAILILLGINILTWQGGTQIKLRKKDLLFPITAAFLFAISTNLRKIGLRKNRYPVIGAAITSAASLAVLLISFIILRARNTKFGSLKLNKDAVKFFGVSGLLLSVAFLFNFVALSSSYVIKIQPITGTTPLFTILFSYFFLKDVEKITSRIILGTIFIVSGIALICL